MEVSMMQALDDAGLQAQTAKFRERLAAGETLDDLLPEAFATVREAAVRTLAPATPCPYLPHGTGPWMGGAAALTPAAAPARPARATQRSIMGRAMAAAA